MKTNAKGGDGVKSVGIICEYNPFHKGHLRQISLLRERGDVDTVVCLMSGNITQRGELACTDKYTRAEAALLSGVDLVLELPYPYSAASAEFFAAAGVCALDAVGVDEINFGSESGDADRLKAMAEATSTEAFSKLYASILEKSPELGSAAAYEMACREAFGGEFFGQSNDLLALSYFRAAHRARIETPLTVIKREGADYSETDIGRFEYPSATGIRRLFESGEFEKAFAYMPNEAADVYRAAYKNSSFPTDMSKIESAVLSFFRLTDPETLDGIAEASGGVAQRLCGAARKATDLGSFFELAATKRYTDARLRRAVIFCMTGVRADDVRSTPEYLTLLAANEKGRRFLSERKANGIKTVTKPADAPDGRQKLLSRRADELYTLTLPKPCASDIYMRCSPKISEKD